MFLAPAQVPVVGQNGWKEIAHVGKCRILVQQDKKSADPSLVYIVVGGKKVWGKDLDSGLIYQQSRKSHSFLLAYPPFGFSIFNLDGTVRRYIPFLAVRADPRPFLFSDPYVVWGADIFNWIKFDAYNLHWQAETREYHDLNLLTGKDIRLPSMRVLGVPLWVNGNVMCSIVPVNWKDSLGKASARQYWLMAWNLKNGRELQKAWIQVSGIGERAVLGLVTGLDSMNRLEVVKVQNRRTVRMTWRVEDIGVTKWKFRLPPGWKY